MNSLVAYCLLALTVMIMFNIILPVEGQCTLLGCETDDSSNNIVAQMRELNSQLDTIVTRLEAVDRRSQEQDIFTRQVLNASLQQMKTQQDTVLARLEANLEAVAQSIKNQTHISWRLATAFGIGDWIVIMHRFDGSVNFSRNWVDYRNGFGDKERGEFWLGNEEVHRLTNRFVYTLRVEVQLKSSGEWYYAEYSSFSLDSESNKYKLRLSGYSGNAGDPLTNTSLPSHEYLNGMNFSTWDHDNDRHPAGNCAQFHSNAHLITGQSGWWFNSCCRACLTCTYPRGFYWHVYSRWQRSGILRAARMMIRSA